MRAEIEALPEPAARYAGRSGPLQLLVVGGSLGAQVLNETLPAALALLAPGERPRVTHQAGAAEADAVRAAYAAAGIAAEVLPFIDDMPQRPGGVRPDGLPRRRHHGQRTVRRRRAGDPGAAGRQHHRAPARQRGLDGRPAGAAVHLPQAELTPQALADALRRLDRAALLARWPRGRRALAAPAWPRRASPTRSRRLAAHERA